MTASQLDQIIDAYAEDAVAHAGGLDVVLDYSADSIGKLEKILRQLHSTLPKDSGGKVPPTFEDNLSQMSKMYGSYLGATIQRNFGGEWKLKGSVRDSPSPTLIVSGLEMWPHQRVYERIVNGEKNNAIPYYQYVSEQTVAR
jgi:hypothetical protein